MAMASVTALVVACQGGDDDEGSDRLARGSVIEEGDSLLCGRTADIYVNGSSFAKELHIRVRNGCHGRDTLGTDSMRVWVRSAAGQVVNQQDYRVPFGSTHRGTVSVTAGSSLRVECPRPLLETQLRGCTWQYEYVLR